MERLSTEDFDKPVPGADVLMYQQHFANLALDHSRPESERRHLEANMRVCRDLIDARELMRESLRDLCDGDRIACFCVKVDGDGNVRTQKYSGECLLCRLRAALGVEVGKDAVQ